MRLTENIAVVHKTVLASTLHHTQKLDISCPYEVKLVQQLKPIDYPYRIEFANLADLGPDKIACDSGKAKASTMSECLDRILV